MPTQSPTLLNPSDDEQQTLERRVWVRYPCLMRTTCQPVAARGPEEPHWQAQIRDLSAGGVGLAVVRRFERGTGLTIEIPAEGTYAGDTLLARVVHLRPLREGGWLLGCEFVSPLSEETVQRLVAMKMATPPLPADPPFQRRPPTLHSIGDDDTVETRLPSKATRLNRRPLITDHGEGAASDPACRRPSIIRLRGLSQIIANKVWEGGPQLQVGRLDGLEICIDDLSVSRKHAELAWSREGWTVRDLGSSNGSCLNGKAIGQDARKVRTGDVLQFGVATLVVEDILNQVRTAGQ